MSLNIPGQTPEHEPQSSRFIELRNAAAGLIGSTLVTVIAGQTGTEFYGETIPHPITFVAFGVAIYEANKIGEMAHDYFYSAVIRAMKVPNTLQGEQSRIQ